MNKEEIKIITLGDVFCNLETQEQAFEFLKYIKNLQQENKELKKQLEVGEEQYNDLVEEKEELQEQLSIKTLQLEEYKNQVDKGLYSTCLPYRTGYDKAVEEMENQQKEFIKYLEDESKEIYRDGGLRQNTYKEILQKYKSIIGGKDEDNKQ